MDLLIGCVGGAGEALDQEVGKLFRQTAYLHVDLRRFIADVLTTKHDCRYGEGQFTVSVMDGSRDGHDAS